MAAPSRFLELDLLDNRYPALHGLRFLAIVSVVQYHVTWVFGGEQGIALDGSFVASSLSVFFGMDLFFMLSGFLIGSILLRSLAQAGTQQLRRFYLRRIFRTFPSYYVVLTYLALTTALTAAQRQHLPYEYVYGTNFLNLARPSVVMFWGWSLALEEQFYLTVPLLFFVLHRLGSDRRRVMLLFLLWCSGLAVRLVLFYRHAPWSDIGLYSAIYFRTYTRFDTLVAGILLALPSLGCLWLLLRPWMFGTANLQLVHIFAWGTVTTMMYFGWVLLLLHGDGWIHRALSIPIFRRMATLGYGVYLVHIPLCDRVLVPIAHVLDARHVPMVLVWPASVIALMVASLALAYVMHVLIEKPSLRLRQHLAA
jgi:peptidoglycan/LPS O-acetylase OafA/YrhL